MPRRGKTFEWFRNNHNLSEFTIVHPSVQKKTKNKIDMGVEKIEDVTRVLGSRIFTKWLDYNRRVKCWSQSAMGEGVQPQEPRCASFFTVEEKKMESRRKIKKKDREKEQPENHHRRQSSLLDEFFLFSRWSFKNGRLACKSFSFPRIYFDYFFSIPPALTHSIFSPLPPSQFFFLFSPFLLPFVSRPHAPPSVV